MSAAHVGGVVLLNVVFLAVGYCVLAAALRGASLRGAASYAGVALLAGAGFCGVGLCIAAVAGSTTGSLAFAVVAALVVAAGLAAALVTRGRLGGAPPPPRRPLRFWEDGVATVACSGLVGVSVLGIVGGFRSSPWLDDTWRFWVPKGLILQYHGLLPDVWQHFSSPDSPLWWPIVTSLDLRFAGRDLRAVNAQLAILVVAFLAALARLLWNYVRPSLLWPGLLLVAAMPELFRQAQGGGADVPLAAYAALFCLAAVGWLLRRDPRALAAAFAFGAVAVQIKSEGAPQLVVLALVLSVLGLRGGWRPLLALWAAVGGALALAAPWFAWRSAHGIHGDFTLGRALDVAYLSDRTERLRPSLDALRHNLLTPRDWLLAVPLLAALVAAAAVRRRSALLLVPLLLVFADYAFWVWVNWADPLNLDYRLSTSGYRVVDTAVLIAAAFTPLVAERVLSGEDAFGFIQPSSSSRSASSWTRARRERRSRTSGDSAVPSS